MTVEERVANIEADMRHVRSTLADMKGEAKELRTEFHSFKTEVAKDFGSVRTEMEKGSGSVAKEFGSVRTEMEKGFGLVAKEFGAVRTEMEKGFGLLRTEIAKGNGSVKLWFVSTIGATVVAFLTVLATVLHILGKI